VTSPSAPADVAVDADLAGGEQSRSGAAVGAVRQTGDTAELVGGQALDVAFRVGECCERSQQQPRRPSGSAVAEDRLEKLRVDLALVPRTELCEQDLDRAGVSAANASRFDFD
jgi:hypothetical protein